MSKQKKQGKNLHHRPMATASKQESKDANTLSFLQALFHGTEKGFVEIRQFSRQKGKPIIQFHALPLDRLSATDSGKFDVYFGVAPRSRKPQGHSGGSAKEVEMVTALWADVDWKCFDNDQGKAMDSLHALDKLVPSAIVNSGHGYHVYWFLIAPQPFDQARPYLDRIRVAINPAMDNVSDAPRILRVPGTLNHKDTIPLPVVIELFNPNRRFSLEDFDILPQSVESKSEKTHCERVVAAGQAHSLCQAIRKISDDDLLGNVPISLT